MLVPVVRLVGETNRRLPLPNKGRFITRRGIGFNGQSQEVTRFLGFLFCLKWFQPDWIDVPCSDSSRTTRACRVGNQ